ncbi:3-keto-disaccharide hydrolase [Synoicihabitans lomoniglobus]|uniref:DUF1080 domain-containing protein n=1 Tax=Synoicihabitans lomoniglobus TaxID=2909285 RepID=A0AAF0CQ48_9BACT|nr:DUF1080 domain-containing protein [Opitutaceae bacterium LMO-M01]WED65991.1 DUF1080 domain-containing protein [Opitutaceae bacterium LMO-M01]
MSRLLIAGWIGGAGIALAATAQDERPPASYTNYYTPQPPVVAAPAGGVPSDAIVLFDGSGFAAWESMNPDLTTVPWEIADGAMVVKGRTGNIRTKQAFGDIQLHLEWRAPEHPTENGQKRGNSGVFFMGRYEVQILDSYQNETYVHGGAASVYKQYAPLANATRPPGEWQVYDLVFEAPRFSPGGALITPALITVFHNGVLTQHAVPLAGPTENRGLPAYQYHVPRLPLVLQDHHDPVAFRNIWVRELDLPPIKRGR